MPVQPGAGKGRWPHSLSSSRRRSGSTPGAACARVEAARKCPMRATIKRVHAEAGAGPGLRRDDEMGGTWVPTCAAITVSRPPPGWRWEGGAGAVR